MLLKTIPMFLAIALAGPTLASCGKGSNEWSYTKLDAATFAELGSNISINNNEGHLVIDTETPLFTKTLNIDDIKVFDIDKAIRSVRSRGTESYLDYQTISNYSVEVKNIETEEDLSGIDVTFQAEKGKHYAALINKDVSVVHTYIICNEVKKTLTTYSDAQLEFEEQYITRPVNFKEGVDFMWSVITNAAYAIVGVETASPTAVASGIIGISTAIFKQLNSDSGPSIPDVIKKLDVIDEKIDDLTKKLDKNTQMLMDEQLFIEAKIDEAAIRDCNASINAFTTDYVVPVQDFMRDFGDYLSQRYKSFINDVETINIYFDKNEKGESVPASILKENPASQTLSQLIIPRFPNSSRFLKEHANIVEEGFMDAFYRDIEVRVSMTEDYPADVTPKDMRNYVAANILEHFTQDYFFENHQKALDIKNMVINLSKRLTGSLGSPVVTDYISRLEYMYNFGGEMKVAATDVCSNLMKLIDNCIGIASQACAFAETSSRELRDAFISAREYIQSTFENITKISDSYCFTTQTVAEGGLYRYQYDAYYSNKGDEPVFHGNILVDKVSGGINWGFKPVTASKINYFGQNDHSKLKTRLRMMRNSGMDLPETYLEYLAYAGGIPEDAIATYEALHAFRWVSDDALRIITGLTTRNLNASKDTFNLSVKDWGNDGCALFEEDWKGKYQSRWEKEGWSGKIAETNYLSASNGEVMSNHRVCAYARYYQDMIFFMDDEFWSFVDNLSGNYMFMLSHN